MIKGLVTILAFTSALSLSSVPISHSEEPLQIEEVYGIICQPHFAWNCNQMVRTAYRESRYIPTATNKDCYPYNLNPATGKPYICAGILQVMEIHVSNWLDLHDPYYCVEVAYSLWLKSGATPWGE